MLTSRGMTIFDIPPKAIDGHNLTLSLPNPFFTRLITLMARARLEFSLINENIWCALPLKLQTQWSTLKFLIETQILHMLFRNTLCGLCENKHSLEKLLDTGSYMQVASMNTECFWVTLPVCSEQLFPCPSHLILLSYWPGVKSRRLLLLRATGRRVLIFTTIFQHCLCNVHLFRKHVPWIDKLWGCV